ncbi:spore coat protein U domain-containing protein [Psychrobacter proteolyticus]|uniref:spore coat protein U domain-containing protein n=1 Tax=Psychrobacter proteolyticus TaxID=147825 RepID=UPI0013B425F3|nr:spore coat protein U domain-containing protein [Psychrobacter proteolyticus]
MQFNKTLLAATLLTAGGFAAISSANAADTSDFKVTTTIDASCTVDASGANIVFGTIAANTLAEATTISNKASAEGILVTCSKGAPYVIKLASAGITSTTGEGKMIGTGVNDNTITYQLNSTDTGTAWGNLESNDVTGTGLGLSTAVPHLVYATITGSTDVKEDTYTDTITASITY